MDSSALRWPNGRKVAVAVKVMFETWSDQAAPSYTVTHNEKKPGAIDYSARAWASYGGRVGVWRILDTLDRRQVPATFFTSARCVEEYPDAMKQIARSAHDIAGHSYTQDQYLSYMSAEEQQALIRKCIDLLTHFTGRTITGWASPAVGFTPDTAGLLAAAGLVWHSDVAYLDLPHRIETKYGPIVAVPTTDFSDLRVLRSNPRDFFDAYKGMFDYLHKRDEISLIVLLLHCQFGGRPLMTAVFDEILEYIGKAPDVWFARHYELARWALDGSINEKACVSRFLHAGDPGLRP